jgi:hypothetical protein
MHDSSCTAHNRTDIDTSECSISPALCIPRRILTAVIESNEAIVPRIRSVYTNYRRINVGFTAGIGNKNARSERPLPDIVHVHDQGSAAGYAETRAQTGLEAEAEGGAIRLAFNKE